MKTVPIANITKQYRASNESFDEELLNLYKQAYKGELLCCKAIIKTEGIVPFSRFRPHISEGLKAYFENCLQEEKGPYPVVYQKEDIFIMSDDYRAYYFFLERGHKEISCVVLGNATGPFVLVKSQPFILPIPTVVSEVVN